MSLNSPLDPEEHSIYHTFKKSKWINSKFLFPRLCIMLIFLGWVTFPIYLKVSNLDKDFKELKNISYSLWLLNQMMIPLHTLLICGCGMDRSYLLHLLLTGIFEFAFCTMFSLGNGLSPWIIPSIACQLMAYIYWYIPTRILYFKTFNLAKAFFNLPGNTLLKKLVLPWSILFTICACIITSLFLLSDFAGRLTVAGFICTASTMLFELYMYSQINPLKNGFTFFSSWKEKVYFLVAIAAILIAIAEVIVIERTKIAEENLDGSLIYLFCRTVAKVIQICRYIILWYYCIDELRFDTEKDSDSTIEINIHDDVLDLSKLSEQELAALEVR